MITTYYAQSDLIDELVEAFGLKFERIKRYDKLIMLAAIAFNAATGDPADSVLNDLDPDVLIDEHISMAIRYLFDEPERVRLALLVALASQLNDGQFAGGNL